MIVLLLHVCVYTRVCFNNTRLCVFVFFCFVLYIHALLLVSCAVCNTPSDQSTWVPELPPGVTETKNLQLRTLIASCCNEDPSKRPTMTTVVKRLQEIQEDPSQESSKAPKRKERG